MFTLSARHLKNGFHKNCKMNLSSSISLLKRIAPLETRVKEMHPETYAITSRWFVPPKVKQESKKVAVPFYEGILMSKLKLIPSFI